MKVTSVETHLVRGGWGPWLFLIIRADDGSCGYGECSDLANPLAVTGCVADLTPLVLGTDPRRFLLHELDLRRRSVASSGGVATKAIAGIECALIDLAARNLGVSVAEMVGGPIRQEVEAYWSHLGTGHIMADRRNGTSQVRNWDDVSLIAHKVTELGFRAIKTNLFTPGEPPEMLLLPRFGTSAPRGFIEPRLLDAAEEQMGKLRDAVGPACGLALDVGSYFEASALVALGERLRPQQLSWLEADLANPQALRRVAERIPARLGTGENLLGPEQYHPYLQVGAASLYLVDVLWNGFSAARRIADLAALYGCAVAPHNCYSHLATCVSAQFAAVVPNVEILEMEGDTVDWDDDLVTVVPTVRDGRVVVPSGPGWGTELNEEALVEYAWTPGMGPW